MNSYFMESVCKTGIFIICAQVLLHFRPKASYEKYLKMLVSAMILIQLFVPVSDLFKGDGELSLEDRVTLFEEELKLRMEEASLGYEEQISELEDMDEGKQAGQGTLESIEPVEQIEITIERGDEADAATGTGDRP